MSALNNFVYFLQIYLSSQASFKILPINKLIDFSTIDVIFVFLSFVTKFESLQNCRYHYELSSMKSPL